MTQRKEIIGNCELYLGDCREILPTLGRFDAVVTDPPYGIGEHGGKERLPTNRKSHRVLEDLGWDDERPDRAIFDLIIAAADHHIIWGANYFSDYLPPSMGWLYWDKRMGGDFSDGELAYTSMWKALRSFSHYNKMQGRQHPTEKPIELMRWCLDRLPSECSAIVDPFMGSGTTGIACVNRGKRFVGIELEPIYFDIACRRIESAMRQPDLFVEPPKPAEQLTLIGAE